MKHVLLQRNRNAKDRAIPNALNELFTPEQFQ